MINDEMYQRFKIMAGELAFIELQLRLLFDRYDLNPRESNGKFKDKFDKVIAIAYETFEFTEEERDDLRFVQNVRNGLLHGNSSQAGKAVKAKEPKLFRRSPVFIINLEADSIERGEPEKTEQGLYIHLLMLTSGESFTEVMLRTKRISKAIDKISNVTARQTSIK